MADQVFKGKIIRGASHIHIYHEKRHCDVWMWGHLGGGGRVMTFLNANSVENIDN